MVAFAESRAATPEILKRIQLQAGRLICEECQTVWRRALDVFEAVVLNPAATVATLRRAAMMIDRSVTWSPIRCNDMGARLLTLIARRLAHDKTFAVSRESAPLAMDCVISASKIDYFTPHVDDALCADVVRLSVARSWPIDTAAPGLEEAGLAMELVRHIGSFDGDAGETARFETFGGECNRCFRLGMGRTTSAYPRALWRAACGRSSSLGASAAAVFERLVREVRGIGRTMSAEEIASASRCFAVQTVDTREHALRRMGGVLNATFALLRHTAAEDLPPILVGVGALCAAGMRADAVLSPGSVDAAVVAQRLAEMCSARNALLGRLEQG
mmetsp:Transcript_68865/g.190621  ORF Transcript_68865/g.190621 Transcript_68865/m.190621 type:complete len:331 (-) Transcript_68865:31-1023(-)